MDEEPTVCFICSITTRPLDNGENNLGTRRTKASLLENQLDVIFILRNLLKVPRIYLVHQLKECWDNPEDWISLCDQCIQLTDKARTLHQQIKKIEKRLKMIEKEVVEKITSSCIDDDDKDGERAYQDNSIEFQKKIRSFVRQNVDHEDEDRLLEGDKLANYLASQQNSSKAQILMVELENPVEIQEDFKLDIESPPGSPPSEENPSVESSSSEDEMDEESKEEMEEHAVKITRSVKWTTWKTEVDPLSSPSDELVILSSSENDDDDNDSIKITNVIKPKTGAVKRSSPLFKCLYCGKQFPDESTEKYHMSLVHAHRMPKENLSICNCPHCGKQYSCQKSLEDHLRKKHDNVVIRFKCLLCEKTLASDPGRNLHLLLCHKDDPVTLKLQEEKGISLHKCPLGCHKYYLTKNELDKHFNWSHPGVDREAKVKRKSRITEDGKFECGICERIFHLPKYWSEHQWKRHDVKEFPCPVEDCGGVFNGKGGDEFATHWNTIHKKKNKKVEGEKEEKKGEGPWICEICGVEKSSRKSLYAHRSGVHKILVKGPRVQKKLQILVNGKPVEVQGKERKVEEEPVLCNLCGKELKNKETLKSHVKVVHDKEISMSCHVCGKGVGGRNRLNYHLLTKHGEDPVTKQLEDEEGLKLSRCEVVGCSATYLRKELLDKHVEKVHKGGDRGGEEEVEKKFKCKYCGKGFWMGQRLKRHEETHGAKGREDFKCELCGKGFGTRRYLRYHELMTHKQAKKFQK